jgi:hypothetical protein
VLLLPWSAIAWSTITRPCLSDRASPGWMAHAPGKSTASTAVDVIVASLCHG